MNGKVIEQLGIKSGDVLTLTRIEIHEDVQQAALVDPNTGYLTEKAKAIFDEWFDMYSTEEGVMTPESTTAFIRGSTNEPVGADDSRIAGLFKAYDANKDGRLEREDFVRFYFEASRDKPDRVFDNIRNHLIRADLVKLCDVQD